MGGEVTHGRGGVHHCRVGVVYSGVDIKIIVASCDVVIVPELGDLCVSSGVRHGRRRAIPRPRGDVERYDFSGPGVVRIVSPRYEKDILVAHGHCIRGWVVGPVPHDGPHVGFRVVAVHFLDDVVVWDCSPSNNAKQTSRFRVVVAVSTARI